MEAVVSAAGVEPPVPLGEPPGKESRMWMAAVSVSHPLQLGYRGRPTGDAGALHRRAAPQPGPAPGEAEGGLEVAGEARVGQQLRGAMGKLPQGLGPSAGLGSRKNMAAA